MNSFLKTLSLSLMLFCIVVTVAAQGIEIPEGPLFYKAINPKSMVSSGDYSYVLDGSGYAVDLSVFHVPNNFEVSFVKSMTIPFVNSVYYYNYRLISSGNLLCVLGPEDIVLMDITDPANPQWIHYLNGMGDVYKAKIMGNMIFVPCAELIYCIDVSIPSQTYVCDSFLEVSAQALHVRDSQLVVQTSDSVYQVYDVEYPGTFTYLGTYEFSGSETLMGLQGQKLITKTTNEVRIYQASELLSPSFEHSIYVEDLGVHGVYIQEELLAINKRYTNGPDDFIVMSFYDPTQPGYPQIDSYSPGWVEDSVCMDQVNRLIKRGYGEYSFFTHDQNQLSERTFSGRAAAVACLTDQRVYLHFDGRSLQPYDAVNPLGAYFDEYFLDNLYLAENLDDLLVTVQSETYSEPYGIHTLRLHDASDPNAIQELGSYELSNVGNFIDQISLSEDRMALTTMSGRVFICDISDPQDIDVLMVLDDENTYTSAVIEGSMLYLVSGETNQSGKLFVYEEDSSGFHLLSQTQLSSRVSRIRKHQNLVYISGYYSALYSYDVSNPSLPTLYQSLYGSVGTVDFDIHQNALILNKHFDSSNSSELEFYSLEGDPERPPVAYRGYSGHITGFKASGDYLFIGTTKGARKLDCSQVYSALETDPGTQHNPPLIHRISVYPNPFSHSTNIILDKSTTEAQMGQSKVLIYNLRGQVIRTLTTSGRDGQELVWDGRDDAGREAASGLYMIRAVSGSIASELRKVVKY